MVQSYVKCKFAAQFCSFFLRKSRMFTLDKEFNSSYKSDFTMTTCSIEGIFVINLKRSEERLKKFQERAQKESIPVSIWEAVDGPRLDWQTLNDAGASFWALENLTKKRKGELGCFLSHRSLWYSLQKISHKDNTGYLILEDDVQFAEGFLQKLSSVLRYVPSNWDIVYVGCTHPAYIDEKGNSPVKQIKSCSGTYGYIIRATTIPRIKPYIRLIGEPIDTMLNRLMKYLNVYALVNPLVTADYTITSDILGTK